MSRCGLEECDSYSGCMFNCGYHAETIKESFVMLKLFLKYVLHAIAFWSILLTVGGLSVKYLDFLIGYFEGNFIHTYIAFILGCMTLWSAISVFIERKFNG